VSGSPVFIAIAAIWLLSVVSLVRGLAEQWVAPGSTWNSHELRRLLNFLPFLVSLLVFGAGIYILSSYSYTDEERRWGYAIIGAIIGYWLRGTIR